MVAMALDLVGSKSKRYHNLHHGMTPESGFDCSGFIVCIARYAFGAYGLDDTRMPRHANEQWRMFGEFVAYDKRIAGDLVYFPSRKKSGRYIIGHVGIVVGKDTYVHAPGIDGTIVEEAALVGEPVPLPDSTDDDLYTHTPAGIKRIAAPIGSGRWHIY